jgi:hypothetical protein
LNSTFQDIEVSMNSLVQDSMLLLPRPYPGFLPVWFKASGNSLLNISIVEKIQLTVGSELSESEFKKRHSLEVERVWLEKRK